MKSPTPVSFLFLWLYCSPSTTMNDKSCNPCTWRERKTQESRTRKWKEISNWLKPLFPFLSSRRRALTNSTKDIAYWNPCQEKAVTRICSRVPSSSLLCPSPTVTYSRKTCPSPKKDRTKWMARSVYPRKKPLVHCLYSAVNRHVVLEYGFVKWRRHVLITANNRQWVAQPERWVVIDRN